MSFLKERIMRKERTNALATGSSGIMYVVL